jgi:hypothetical protein
MSFASVDDYLGSLPEQARSVMDELRRTIRAVVPDVGEKLSDGRADVGCVTLGRRPTVAETARVGPRRDRPRDGGDA